MAEAQSQVRSRLAIGVAVATGLNSLVAVILIALPASDRVAAVASIRVGEAVALGLTWTAFAIVGAVIVRYQPNNAVGWLCSITGVHVSLVAVAVGVATYILAGDSRSPVGAAAAWLAHIGSIAIIAAPLLIFFRFPTGRSLGGRWLWAERLVILTGALCFLLAAIEPMSLSNFPTTPNPFAIDETRRITWVFAPVGASAALAVASLVVRFRRGSPLERRQIRLLSVASILVGAAIVTMPLTSPDMVASGRVSTLTLIVNAVAFSSIPASIGIAIVRHQLYDIDRIVKRTIVYALVSAILGAIYVVAVLGLSTPLHAISPGAGNTLATAASTLLVAALFRPVRARAQAAIDRRFDRQRYEATRMTESFASQVRTEVGLEGIVSDLVFATRATVHPSATGCWIRGRVPADGALVASPGRS